MHLRSFSRFRTTPRAVWFAFGTALVLCIGIAILILVPVLGLIGSAVSFLPFAPVPWGRIAVTVVAGYLLAAGLLVLIAISRHGPVAWVLAVAAVAATLIVSIYPVVAVALAAVDEVGDVIPFITEWITRIRSGNPF